MQPGEAMNSIGMETSSTIALPSRGLRSTDRVGSVSCSFASLICSVSSTDSATPCDVSSSSESEADFAIADRSSGLSKAYVLPDSGVAVSARWTRSTSEKKLDDDSDQREPEDDDDDAVSSPTSGNSPERPTERGEEESAATRPTADAPAKPRSVEEASGSAGAAAPVQDVAALLAIDPGTSGTQSKAVSEAVSAMLPVSIAATGSDAHMETAFEVRISSDTAQCPVSEEGTNPPGAETGPEVDACLLTGGGARAVSVNREPSESARSRAWKEESSSTAAENPSAEKSAQIRTATQSDPVGTVRSLETPVVRTSDAKVTTAAESPPIPASREPQAPQPTTARVSSISLKLNDTAQGEVRLQVSQTAGELRLAVRTADVGLRDTLRGGLTELVSSMSKNGIRAEASAIGTTVRAGETADTRSADSNRGESGDPGNQGQGRSDSRGQQHQRHSRNAVNWPEEWRRLLSE